MTAQEIFDKVSLHLLTQNEKSIAKDEFGRQKMCLYRGANGLKCAIGCLIPDDKYDREAMEGLAASSFNGDTPSCLPNLLPQDMPRANGKNFLLDMQDIHDRYQPDDWKYKLVEFAERYELSCNL